jgi:acetate---CoA ligase (ADP-forming)
MNLRNFFQPKSIAVVGASNNRQKIGRQILDNIIASGYKGSIYPINLKKKKIAGLSALTSLENIPKRDRNALLVVIAIPASLVALEIEKCGRLGIKDIIVISAGFKEIGKEGLKREENIKFLAKKYDLNILGPNCLGFINNIFGLNASFSKSSVGGGRIAFLSQSGAIGSAVLDWLKGHNLSLAYFISLGNKAVLSENEFLSILGKDKNIDAIIFYLEDIKSGQEFMAKASKISFIKPVIVLKAGSSEQGSRIARSHTGALAGKFEIISAGLKRAGVVMISELESLFNLITILNSKAAHQKLNKKIKIITNAGGLAVLSADAIQKQGLELSDSFDILGNAQAIDYEKTLKQVLKSTDKDVILVLLTPQSATYPLQVAEAITRQAIKHPQKLIITNFLGGESVEEAKNLLIKNNIPVFDYPEMAINALSSVVKRQDGLSEFKPFENNQVKSKKQQVKSDYIALLRKLSSYGIRTVKTVAYQPGRSLTSFPAVLKAVGPDFVHKSDKGLVILDLKDQKQVDKAAAKLIKLNRQALKNKANYLVLQPQQKSGLEIILGIKRDSSFGPILLIGLGGIYAEILQKTEFLIADLNKKQALDALKKMSFFEILKGARGKKYAIKELAQAMVSLCRLVKEHPEIKELDINPLFIQENSILAVDARVFVEFN